MFSPRHSALRLSIRLIWPGHFRSFAGAHRLSPLAEKSFLNSQPPDFGVQLPDIALPRVAGTPFGKDIGGAIDCLFCQSLTCLAVHCASPLSPGWSDLRAKFPAGLKRHLDLCDVIILSTILIRVSSCVTQQAGGQRVCCAWR